MAKDFYELPFFDRPDLSPFIIHLTKSGNGRSAFENLVEIMKSATLNGSNSDGYIRGTNKACCFMDVPFSSLKYVLTKENRNPEHPRYEPYGFFITKKFAYEHDARPVMYLSNEEISTLQISKADQWRVVRFEVDKEGNWISWMHEREWRAKGDFKLPTNCGVLVKGPKDYQLLSDLIAQDPEVFKIKPHSIIPIGIVCQGLLRQ